MNFTKSHIDNNLFGYYGFKLDERSRPFTFIVKKECKLICVHKETIHMYIDDDYNTEQREVDVYEFEIDVPCNKEFNIDDIADINSHRDAKEKDTIICEVVLKSTSESIFVQDLRQDNNCSTFAHFPFALAQIELYDTLKQQQAEINSLISNAQSLIFR